MNMTTNAPVATPTANKPTCSICCTDSGDHELVKPCLHCKADYCSECLTEMFKEALHDPGRMPPKCCSFLQPHIGLRYLDDKDQETFRKRFEEWITSDRVYCPVPKYSAFVPPRLMDVPTLCLRDDQQFVWISPSALKQIYKDIRDLPKIPDAFKKVRTDDISFFTSFIGRSQGIKDLHEFATAFAMTLFERALSRYSNGLYSIEVSFPMARTILPEAMNIIEQGIVRIVHSYIKDEVARVPRPTRILCPDCSVEICTKCRQKAHHGQPCDRSQAEYEASLLRKFKVKQCPKCRAAVKRMYGCSHMQCLCGAHWCWNCQLPIDECNGAHEEEFSDEEGDSEDDQDDDDEDGGAPMDLSDGEEGSDGTSNVDGQIVQANVAPPGLPLTTPMHTADGTMVRVIPEPIAGADAADVARPTTAVDHQARANENRNADRLRPPATVVDRQPRADEDLDAGGQARWADGHLDFGDEPSDDYRHQTWDCEHHFKKVRSDGTFRGVGSNTIVECNRCFVKMDPYIAPKASSIDKIHVGTQTAVTQTTAAVAAQPQGPGWTHPASINRNIVPRPWHHYVGAEKAMKPLPSPLTPYCCVRCNLLYCAKCKMKEGW